MSNLVIVGTQWGDEGKGKIVDLLASTADAVVRFQGGHNAGHTLVINSNTFKLSLLPSGIVRQKLSIIGNGVVVDPIHLEKEIEQITNQGIEVKSSNFVIDFYVKQNLLRNTFLKNKRDQLILNEIFFQQPYEVIFRSLSESIKLIGEKYYSARGSKLDRIILNVQNNESFKVTLGDCIIERVNQTVIISKEL